MGDAVVVADKDNNFLVFNPAAERMFGKGAMERPPAEWPQHYGLYLPDKVTPFPHDQLPITRSIRGEEVDDVEMFVHDMKRRPTASGPESLVDRCAALTVIC